MLTNRQNEIRTMAPTAVLESGPTGLTTARGWLLSMSQDGRFHSISSKENFKGIAPWRPPWLMRKAWLRRSTSTRPMA